MEQTSIKRFRPHPLYILSNLWRYLFILLLPLVRGLYYVVINSFSLTGGFQLAVNISNWLQGAWVDVLSLLVLDVGELAKKLPARVTQTEEKSALDVCVCAEVEAVTGVLLWATFVVELTADGLLVRRGVFRREVSFLPSSQYYCVSLVAPLRLRVFGAQYLRVDTAGGNLTQADLLVMLRRRDCEQIIRMLQTPSTVTAPGHTRVYSPKNRYVFVLAMITSNSFAGMVLISTLITQMGSILGEQFSEMIYGTFENVARTLAFGVPPAAFALACVLLFGYLCAFAVSLLRHANFHVRRRKNLLEVRAGLLTKRSYRIAADKIGYLDIRRSLLTCLLGVYSIFLSTVGYGKFRDDVSALIPCVRKKQLERSLRLLLPEYRISQRKVAPHRLRSAVRYIWRAAALLVLVLLLRGILSLLFPGWVELIQWVSFMASVPLIWLLIVKVIDLFTAGLSYEDGCYTLRYSKGFSLHAVVIRRGRIAKVRIGQSIFQKRTGRCDLYLYSYSEGRQRHHLRDLKREEVEDLFSFMDTESSGNL